MKNVAGKIAILILLLPALSFSAELGIDGTTLFRFEERSATGFDKQRVIPATQFLGVDMGKIGDGNLSFHLFGWGRVDLAERSTAEGTTEGNLTYGYLAYRLPKGNGQIKAGRFFTFEGGTTEQVDGVSARADLQKNFVVSVFGGVPTTLDQSNDNKGDYIAGGRLGYRAAGLLELGISALHEKGAASRNVDATTDALRTIKDYRQLLGLDFWFSPHGTMEFTGRTSYDTAVEEVAQQSYLITIRPVKKISIAGDYNENRFQSFFSSTSLPSLFKPRNGDKFTSYGVTATYVVANPLEVTADFKRSNYRSTGHGDTNRYGIEGRLLLLDGKVRSGISYHRIDSGTAGINSYDEIFGYGIYTAARFFASLDVISHLFDEPVYDKNTAYQVTASAGYRITPELALSGNFSYGENPQQTEDTKAIIKITYNYETKGAR